MRPTNEFSADFDPAAFDPPLITTLDQVTAWLGKPNLDQALIGDAWLAAEAYVAERTQRDTAMTASDSLVQAVDLLTARYLARRNSPDGMVGLGDLGPAQVPFSDIDVERLINPWRFFPVA